MRPPTSRSGTRWLRRLGQYLVIVAQLVVLFAPISESHEERGLAAHVEVPGSRQHPSHNPERCPACVLLAIHSCAAKRAELPPIARAERVPVPASSQYATKGADAPANSCRAPPTTV
jgi:hypothetical protein